MNTFIHLIAIFLLVGYAWYLLDQGSTMATVAGTGVIGLTLVFVAWLFSALKEDVQDHRDDD